VKLICVLATGYNVVDCEDTKRRGIPVCNVPAYGTDAVAQFTFALLLEICHQVGHHSKAVHDGRWSENRDFCFWDTPQMELAGKTIGIIGFGKIGRAVGRIAKAMGMKVIAYNRSRCPEGEAVGTYVDLETLLKTADVVSLHCPLTAENAGLINKEALAQMKDSAILLNTARGPLLDEQAVADALHSGKLRGAAVDVVSKEPMEKTNPLLTAPNCIITPHMAWAPTESRQRILECTARSIAAFLDGKPINTVNM
jgi:glycerate dehydrogenase